MRPDFDSLSVCLFDEAVPLFDGGGAEQSAMQMQPGSFGASEPVGKRHREIGEGQVGTQVEP